MERMSHREYLTRLAWLESEWNRPSRSDHYLMRISQRIQQLWNRKANEVTLDQQKVEFTTRKKPTYQPSPEQKLAADKARWFSFLGAKKPKESSRL